jgi:EmrB/QacA subfamily drug resistance transporter
MISQLMISQHRTQEKITAGGSSGAIPVTATESTSNVTVSHAPPFRFLQKARFVLVRRNFAVTPAQTRVLAATILGSSMAFADGSIVTVAIPRMRDALGASLAQMQWVSNGYTLILSAFLLLGGAAGDRFGLRRVYALGIALFALASFGCALCSSAQELIAARALQGLGGAMMVPGSLALLSAHFAQAERGRAIGAWAAATSIAASLGPLLGGWLIDHAPWRTIFIINLPLAAFALAITLCGIAVLPANEARPMDWLGGLLAVGGLGAIALGLTLAGEADPSFSGYAIWVCLGGLALLAVFLAWEAHTPAPMMPLRLFRSRQIAGVNALTLLLYFALAGAIFFLPSTLIQADGWSAEKSGSIFLAFTAMLATLSRFGGIIADRFGVRLPLTVGPAVTAASFIILGLAVANGGYWNAMIPAMLVLGLGMGITVAPLSTAVMNGAPAGQSGIASAINNAVARVAGLIAVASLGAVAGDALVGGSRAAALAGFSRLTWICAAAAAMSAVVAYVTLRDEPR